MAMERRYLDPRNDLVFKRIFGEHPHILRSFLNALLPLPDDGKIASLEYLPGEQVPQVPLLKHTIVDVRCVDERGRQFIVEMQMNWTNAFLQRVLFNASKAYVRQLEKGEDYELLKPVVGLSLLNAVFDRETDSFYHHYQIVNTEQPRRTIEGLQLVFVELPKFIPGRDRGRALRDAWLRFLRETGDADTPEEIRHLDQEIASQSPEIRQAVEIAGESGFTLAELEAYDRYWDGISSERTLIAGKFAEGRAEGRAEGIAEGIAEGMARKAGEIRGKLRDRGLSDAEIDELL